MHRFTPAFVFALPQILDVSGNNLDSLEGLPEGCLQLHELYLAENPRLHSLAGLSRCAPNLETLVGTLWPSLT